MIQGGTCTSKIIEKTFCNKKFIFCLPYMIFYAKNRVVMFFFWDMQRKKYKIQLQPLDFDCNGISIGKRPKFLKVVFELEFRVTHVVSPKKNITTRFFA